MLTSSEPWDLLVLGGGTAGIVGAKTAARLGARVAMIERDQPGGDCLWTGCVPSKALIAAAGAAAHARGADDLGVHVDGVRVDFAGVMAHVQRSIAAIEPIDSPEALESDGVTVIRGDARFTGKHEVRLDGGERITFAQALLATGGTPTVPPIPGLVDAAPLTSDTVWNLTELPGRLTVLGGGTIGCELAQAFARLGAEVTLIEMAPRILVREDADAAALVRAAMKADGVRILTGQQAARITGTSGAGGTVSTSDAATGAASETVEFDALLVAVGRRPRSAGLGLDRVAVEVDDTGFVTVHDRLRTTNPAIWAAGDVTGRPQFTHVAGVDASLAASNAILGLRRTVQTRAVPRVTFTDPEVAAVGVATDDTRNTRNTRLLTREHAHVDRALAEGRTDGFARLAIDHRHRVVGATVVGPRAGESISELSLAVQNGMTTSDLAGAIHPYPTYSDGPWNAAIADVQQRLAARPVQLAMRALARIDRWRR